MTRPGGGPAIQSLNLSDTRVVATNGQARWIDCPGILVTAVEGSLTAEVENPHISPSLGARDRPMSHPEFLRVIPHGLTGMGPERDLSCIPVLRFSAAGC